SQLWPIKRQTVHTLNKPSGWPHEPTAGSLTCNLPALPAYLTCRCCCPLPVASSGTAASAGPSCCSCNALAAATRCAASSKLRVLSCSPLVACEIASRAQREARRTARTPSPTQAVGMAKTRGGRETGIGQVAYAPL